MLVLVFHPHQRPGWADLFNDRNSLIHAWQNGAYQRFCFIGPEQYDDPTFDDAISDLSHDLNSLTVLDSAEEFESYMAARHHNPAFASVREAAELAGWC